MLRHCELLPLAVRGMQNTECLEASGVTAGGGYEAVPGSTALERLEVRMGVCTWEARLLVGGHSSALGLGMFVSSTWS